MFFAQKGFSPILRSVVRLDHKSQKSLFFIKKDIFVDSSKEGGKMRISEVSKYVLAGLIGLSWIGIGFYVFPSEEKQRLRAEEYLNKSTNYQPNFKSAEAEKPEEYRQEYIDQQKRKFKKLVDTRRKDEETNKQIYEDYKKFGPSDDDEEQVAKSDSKQSITTKRN